MLQGARKGRKRRRRRIADLARVALEVGAFCVCAPRFLRVHARLAPMSQGPVTDPLPYDFHTGNGPPSRPLAATLALMRRLHFESRGLSYESDRNFSMVVNSTFETYPMAGTKAFATTFPNKTASAFQDDDPKAQLSIRRIYQYLPGVGDVSMLVARVANPVGRFSILPPAMGCGVGRNRTSETVIAAAMDPRPTATNSGSSRSALTCKFGTNAGFFVTDAGNPHCLGNIVSRGVRHPTCRTHDH